MVGKGKNTSIRKPAYLVKRTKNLWIPSPTVKGGLSMFMSTSYRLEWYLISDSSCVTDANMQVKRRVHKVCLCFMGTDPT